MSHEKEGSAGNTAQPKLTTHKAIVGKNIIKFSRKVNSSPCRSSNKRGPITGFSKQSYRRLRELIFSLDANFEYFLTLTYPSVFPSPKDSKRHLHNFFKALNRYLPKNVTIWKLEPQKRGAPHYHLLLIANQNIDLKEFRIWVSLTWYRVVGSGDIKHLKAGTNVVKIENNYNTIKRYLAKYFSKSYTKDSDWYYPGRVWGINNRKNLPAIRQKVVLFTKEQFYKIRRVLRKIMSVRCKKFFRFDGFKLDNFTFCGNEQDINKILGYFGHKLLLEYFRDWFVDISTTYFYNSDDERLRITYDRRRKFINSKEYIVTVRG